MTTSAPIKRRSFLRVSSIVGGGLMLGFDWLGTADEVRAEDTPDTIELNGYLKIAADGSVTLMAPNPEAGQNVKTSMPMIVAEELDVDWARVTVEQAPLDTSRFTLQAIGGSQAIRQGWQRLRTAGASARIMLRTAAAQQWQVPVEQVSTSAGVLHHAASGRRAGYGEMASAAARVPVPEKVTLKNPSEFSIIGSSRRNVDGKDIVTGKAAFGLDYRTPGTLIAMIVHPPAFGMQLKSVETARAKAMPGIRDAFSIRLFNDDYTKRFFDTCSFPEVAVVVGDSTWQVMKARDALELSWERSPETSEMRDFFGRKMGPFVIPAGLESSAEHEAAMTARAAEPGNEQRRDGDPDAAFNSAEKVLERHYTAPFLAHNCMEPMNFYANVTADRAELVGPIQKPEFTEQTLSNRLGLPLENIEIRMTRLGGGFGRRSYAHWAIEAALISQRMNAPVKLIYSREDDMTAGIYRPAYHLSYRAALDEHNRLTGFHLRAGGLPESPLRFDIHRFPFGAVDNALMEDWSIDSNITIGSYRAPASNFLAAAEQSFLDEVAETMGKDPIDMRLELLERAEQGIVGDKVNYDPKRYAQVMRTAREKSGWDKPAAPGIHRGFSAYFCHNSYVAQVLELRMENGSPVIQRVCCVIDCGLVINPDAARNMAEGSIVDGIGNAMYGEMRFENGAPQSDNLDNYRIIRHAEAPRSIDIHFIDSDADPTGLGEPPYPPVMAALANALYAATGKRLYRQPYATQLG